MAEDPHRARTDRLPSREWLDRVQDLASRCEQCASDADKINQLAAERWKWEDEALRVEAKGGPEKQKQEQARLLAEASPLEKEIVDLMKPWGDVRSQIQALLADLQKSLKRLPTSDELRKQIEALDLWQYTRVPAAFVPLREVAADLRLLEELLRDRLSDTALEQKKADPQGAAPAETRAGTEGGERRRGRPAKISTARIREALDAFQAGKNWREVTRILYGLRAPTKEDIHRAQCYLSRYLKRQGTSLGELRRSRLATGNPEPVVE